MDEIKFIPTERLYEDVKDSMMPRLQEVFSGKIQGKGSGQCGSDHFDSKFSKLCEDKLKEFIPRKHALITTSGSSSLTLMLMAKGIKAGDEVICTNFSSPATVMPIVQLGAIPVFTDLNRYGQQVLPNIKNLITPKTKAIMITDLYGDCNDYDLLKDIDLPIINDSCQSFLTTYKGVQTQTFGEMSCLSFSTNKNCPVFGTYGAVYTDNDDLAHAIKLMRKKGCASRDVGLGIEFVGINAQPTEDKCVQLLSSLENLTRWQSRRKEIHQKLDTEFKKAGVSVRPSPDYCETNFHKYCIFVKDKWKFRELMSDQNVETHLHYTYNFANTPVLSNNIEQDMPGTEFYRKHSISIPSNPWLTDKEVGCVIEAVKNCVTDEDCATIPEGE